MSGIVALVHGNELPVAQRELEVLLDPLTPRGGDGRGLWTRGRVGLGVERRWTTPEAAVDRHPELELEGCRLVSDARIDNRSELLEELLPGQAAGSVSDERLILEAYVRWGLNAPTRLVGDFAFAIWDGPRARLVCARDPLGVRPLAFRSDFPGIAVASEVSALLRRGTPRIARNRVAALVDLDFEPLRAHTLYEGIERLPAGHRLVYDASGVTVQRYFSFADAVRRPLLEEREWVDRFRATLDQAVEARLRSTASVGFLVSGGLDSSSVAVAAHALAPTTAGRLYTCVFEAGTAADERQFARAVAEACPGFPLTEIPGEELWALARLERYSNRAEPLLTAMPEMLVRPLEQARSEGCKVVLSGHGGDSVLVAHPYHLPRLIPEVDLSHLLEESKHFASVSGRSRLALLAFGFLGRWLPRGMVDRWLARRARAHARRSPWAEPSIRQTTPSPVRALPWGASAAFSHGSLTRAATEVGYIDLDALAAPTGVELRFPFLDRRVVELALALPPTLRYRGGVTKRILRSAYTDLLPDVVRERTGHAHFGELIERGLHRREKRRIQESLDNGRLSGEGFVSKERLKASWGSYWDRSSSSWSRNAQAVLVEHWLRDLPDEVF